MGGDGDCLGERACVHRGGHGSREAHVQDQGWYGDVFRAVRLERLLGGGGVDGHCCADAGIKG